MHPLEPESLAREAVPGSGEPILSRLGSGLLNDTYRVEREGRSFSMRVAIESARGSRLDRAWEIKLLREASQRGLAAPLACGDAERGFLVQEWVEGRSWPATAVRQAANIARMADLLKRVHELPQPVPARIMPPSAWMAHYGAALAGVDGGFALPLANAAAERLASLAALPQSQGVVCHSDLHLMNVLECPLSAGGLSSLKLLDWEYAHVSEAFWDLAGWSANNDFPDRLLRALLCAYLKREPNETEWRRLKLLVWLFDYVCLLWSKLYLTSRGGSAAHDVARRAEVLKARLTGK